MSMRGRQRRKRFEENRKSLLTGIGYFMFTSKKAFDCGNLIAANNFARSAGSNAKMLVSAAKKAYPNDDL